MIKEKPQLQKRIVLEMSDIDSPRKRVIIIGAGPTAMGALTRLCELMNEKVIEVRGYMKSLC